MVTLLQPIIPQHTDKHNSQQQTITLTTGDTQWQRQIITSTSNTTTNKKHWHISTHDGNTNSRQDATTCMTDSDDSMNPEHKLQRIPPVAPGYLNAKQWSKPTHHTGCPANPLLFHYIYMICICVSEECGSAEWRTSRREEGWRRPPHGTPNTLVPRSCVTSRSHTPNNT